MDLFEWKKLTYFIIVDYYSRSIKITQLDRTTAEAVIQRCLILDRREQGTVGYDIAPRSYKVGTPSGTFRRNRRDIIHLPAKYISLGISESHDSDLNKTTSEDRSQSGAGRVAITTDSFPSAE